MHAVSTVHSNENSVRGGVTAAQIKGANDRTKNPNSWVKDETLEILIHQTLRIVEVSDYPEYKKRPFLDVANASSLASRIIDRYRINADLTDLAHFFGHDLKGQAAADDGFRWGFVVTEDDNVISIPAEDLEAENKEIALHLFSEALLATEIRYNWKAEPHTIDKAAFSGPHDEELLALYWSWIRRELFD